MWIRALEIAEERSVVCFAMNGRGRQGLARLLHWELSIPSLDTHVGTVAESSATVCTVFRPSSARVQPHSYCVPPLIYTSCITNEYCTVFHPSSAQVWPLPNKINFICTSCNSTWLSSIPFLPVCITSVTCSEFYSTAQLQQSPSLLLSSHNYYILCIWSRSVLG